MMWVALLIATSIESGDASLPTPSIDFDKGKITVTLNATPTQRLAKAACLGRVDAVRRALDDNARPEIAEAYDDVEGNALFLTAACLRSSGANDDEDRVKIAKMLLDKGVAVSAPGIIRFKALAVPMPPHVAAAYMKRPRLLELLLKNGARLDDGDRARDGSALHWAAEGHCTSCAQLLIAYGAAIERRNHMGLTPLFVAAALNDRAMVRTLLENGANPFVKESAGRSALDAVKDPYVRKQLKAAMYKTIAKYATAGIVLMITLLLVARKLRRNEEPDERPSPT